MSTNDLLQDLCPDTVSYILPYDAIIATHGPRMSILNQAISLVSVPPGSFIYHIVGLFALEAAFAISIGQYRSTPESDFGRFALAAGAALFLRVILAILVVLGIFGFVNESLLLPPLDRAVTFSTLLLIGWAFLSRSDEVTGEIILSVGLVLIAIGTVVALVLWNNFSVSGIDYNNSTHDLLWTAPQVGLLLGIIVMLLWRRPEDWDLGFGIFVLALLGTLLHLGFALGIQILSGHISAFTRMTDLATLPMFALVVYRRVLRLTVVVLDADESSSFIPLLESPVDPGLSPQIAKTLAAIGVETNKSGAIESISRGIGTALGAEIALLWELGDDNLSVRCLGGYDLLRGRKVVGFTLPAAETDSIRTAIKLSTFQRLEPSIDELELRLLADQVGMQYIAPALIASLPSDENEQHYAMMVLSPDSLADWSEDDNQLLLALVDPVTRALANVASEGNSF